MIKTIIAKCLNHHLGNSSCPTRKGREISPRSTRGYSVLLWSHRAQGLLLYIWNELNPGILLCTIVFNLEPKVISRSLEGVEAWNILLEVGI